MSDATPPEVEAGLTRMLKGLAKESQEIMAIFNSAKGGELTEAEAMKAAMEVIQENPELAEKLAEMATSAFAPTRTAMSVLPNSNLAEVGDEAFFRGFGLPQMNPLVEAALAERIQFDGDAPELRHGPMTPGVSPALSVRSKAKSPVAIGEQMERASKKVRKALDVVDKRRADAVGRLAVANAKAMVALEDGGVALTAMAYGSADTDLAEYRRGEVPAPVAVRRAPGKKLGLMTEDQQKEHAWRFLSTTQGRRSAMETLREVIFETLGKAGIEATKREYDPKQKQPPLAFHEWTVNMSGAGAMQPAFNIIDTAGKAIAHHLKKRAQREDILPVPLYLEVVPINTVDVRSVGWAARLVA